MYIFCWRTNHLQRQFWGHCDSWIVIYDRRNPFISLRPGKGTFWIGTGGTKRITITIPISATRLGDFWNFFSTNFLAKEAQMIGNFWAIFKKPLLLQLHWQRLGQFFGEKIYLLLQYLVTLVPIFVSMLNRPFLPQRTTFDIRRQKSNSHFRWLRLTTNRQPTTEPQQWKQKLKQTFLSLG